jgi:predicted phage baseplate assembly protein
MLVVREVRAVSATRDELSWLPALPEPLESARTVLHGNNIVATHGASLSDEPVHIGDGTPGQQFRLGRRPVTHLVIEGARAQRRSRPELEVRVDGVLWEHVDSFFASRPSDLHYTSSIDEDDYFTVDFGTGSRGSVPPPGARIQVRYRIGLGQQGNVGHDTLTVALTAVRGVTGVSNPFPAEGGADRESTDEARISGPGSVIAQERAVTLEDYELLAAGFPGVGKVKARVGLRGAYKVVQVYVAPEAPTTLPPPSPSDALRESLARFLEERMPVNRMAGVDVLEPTYVPVDGMVEAHVNADASRSRVTADVTARLRELLSFPNQQIGRSVRVGEIFATLAPIPGLAYVVLRRLQRRGQPPPDECGFADVAIAENEMAFEGAMTVNTFGGLP